MKNELVFNNQELGLKVRTIKNEDGSISVSAYDTAIGFGWGKTEIKNGKEYSSVRWATINSYCKEFGFDNELSKDDFIPESLFYMLGMKANNEKAVDFQRWIAVDVLPSIRQKGHYTSNNEQAKTNAVADGISGITSPATLELMQAMLNDQKILLEVNRKLELENQTMQPKADGYDELIESKGDLDFKEFTKSVDGLSMGRNLFMGILRDKKILLNNNTPYQTYIERGYFRVIQTSNGFHSSPKTLVTKKGVDWLIKKCREWDLI